MANSTLNPKEFVQRSFSPYIAILGSSLVDEICQKNNVSFIELIEPFCSLSKEVSYRDPSGSQVVLKNLKICCYDINAKPPEAAIARKLLNESVSSASEEIVETINFKSGSIVVDVPATVPWFEKWREMFLKVQFPSDHEFTKHYIACMIVITSKEDNPMDTLSNMVQQLQHTLSMSPPKMIPKWFSSSVLRYYVLLHDVVSCDLKKAEKVFEEMKSTYNSQCCYMLQINSQSSGNPIVVPDYWGKTQKENAFNDFSNDIGLTDSFSMNTPTQIETGQEVLEQMKPEILNHPLSPQLEKQLTGGDISRKGNETVDSLETQEQPGACLTADDIERIKTLVSNFITSALIPFVETQMQYLNEMVSNKKGVSKSFLSATKRWFGGPKPGSPMNVPNSHYYHPDSPELHMRRLGDLCFMFGAYTCAFQAYHSAKRDFLSDSAWLYYAGALEMAALSAFLIGLDIKKAQEYTEDSIGYYLHTCRMPQFATRLTLCVTECLKDLGMFGEAAGRLLLMTSEDSDLRSALLLEEASYCFIKSKKPCMPRKYAFHLVLAGHRFAKAGQKRHSLRCYRQAYQVYQNKGWSLAEDHIHFTIGRLASSLKQKEITAAEFAKLFINPSTQLPAQQSTFLKDYFLSLIELQKEGKSEMPFLQIPHVDHSSIKAVSNVFENTDLIEGCTLARKEITEEEQTNNRWRKLEESLVSFSNNNSLPPTFKPTLSVFSNSTDNSVKPICVIEERIQTSVDLVNILNISLYLQNVELLWVHSASQDDASIDKNSLAVTEVLDSVILDPDASTKVSLHITPKFPGDLHITGIKYTVVLKPSNEGADTISITGYTTLNPRGMRIMTKEPKSEPQYKPDYRLQFRIIDSAPCLQIYFKDLPTEMLCGEIQPVVVTLKNTGRLPINRVLFTANQPALFSVSHCKPGSKIYQLQTKPIAPGQCTEVTIFLKACDKSGQTSIDLLFYYDTDKASQQKLKYRLIYHTLHLLVHESIHASVSVTRSIMNSDDSEVIIIRLQVQNKNQTSDLIRAIISLQQVSLFSSNWQLYKVISSSDDVSVKLEQEQVAFVTLKAKRLKTENNYSDLLLNDEESVVSVDKPYRNFTESIVTKLINIDKPPDKNVSNDESVNNINSLIILYWKGEVNRNDNLYTVTGQHHLPLLKFGQKYSSTESDYLNETKLPILSPFVSTVSIPTVYYNNPVAKELLLIKMNHPAIVTHRFKLNRICTVSVDLIVQNCCDYSVEVKFDSTYQTPNNLSKVNESSLFLWLGVVLNTFVIEQHSFVKMPLCVCVGNSGTYDLGSQLVISARKFNSENIFVAQSSVPRSLLCVSNEVL